MSPLGLSAICSPRLISAGVIAMLGFCSLLKSLLGACLRVISPLGFRKPLESQLSKRGRAGAEAEPDRLWVAEPGWLPLPYPTGLAGEAPGIEPSVFT